MLVAASDFSVKIGHAVSLAVAVSKDADDAFRALVAGLKHGTDDATDRATGDRDQNRGPRWKHRPTLTDP